MLVDVHVPQQISNMNNKEIHARRDFFKKAAKTILPVVGSVIIATPPIAVYAKEMPRMGCHGCKDECFLGCGGCSHGCEGCTGTCNDGCSSTCLGRCSGDCQGNCQGDCMGNCKGDCQGSCQNTCAGSSK